MDLMEALTTRRSVRRFEPRPVPGELVKMMLRAAMQAPSAANAQPWHFVVITERLALEKVTEFHPAAESLHQATLAILVCGDSQLEKRPDRWIMDCSAATQNILLAAHASGLGAVWLGIHPDPIRIEGIAAPGQPPRPCSSAFAGCGWLPGTRSQAGRPVPYRTHPLRNLVTR
jgi:nitroreductase